MRDATAIAGLFFLSAGCAWAWPPLGLIVLGGVMLAAAIWGHLRDGAKRPQKGELSDAASSETFGSGRP